MRIVFSYLICLVLLCSVSCTANDADSDGDIDGDTDSPEQESDEGIDGDADGDDDSIEPPDGDTELEMEGELAEMEEEMEIPEGPYHDPWLVMPTSELPPVRDWVIKRGIVHTHSPYSHDACDDEPFIEGIRNEECFLDCRFGMCDTRQDYVFLTDHDNLYAEYEYPEVLLYAEGDSLIMRDNLPVANRLDCGDGHQVIVSAGTESEMMPIGLEHHVGETIPERKAAYNASGEDAVLALQDAGALVFLQHTEGWDQEIIDDLPIDGIEMYNLHQNLMTNMGAAIEMILKMETEPESLPVMELGVISIFMESEEDLLRWSKAVMLKPLPAVLATDSHRNVFNGPSPDGERIDSFRRMMHWFSNYVMIPDGEFDDRTLKEAIGHGRMYGAFDFLGYPTGFDFHALAGDTVYEMGDQAPAADLHLKVSIPKVFKMDPFGPKPVITARILKANDGEWLEVASATEDLDITVDAGAYRAEIRILPEHLRPWLGPEADTYIKEFIWIYSNPIYVGMDY